MNYDKLSCSTQVSFSTMELGEQNTKSVSEVQEIKEGKAVIKTGGKVFYNIVQEFNRDLRYLFKMES